LAHTTEDEKPFSIAIAIETSHLIFLAHYAFVAPDPGSDFLWLLWKLERFPNFSLSLSQSTQGSVQTVTAAVVTIL
jgi:hypothetical protein